MNGRAYEIARWDYMGMGFKFRESGMEMGTKSLIWYVKSVPEPLLSRRRSSFSSRFIFWTFSVLVCLTSGY